MRVRRLCAGVLAAEPVAAQKGGPFAGIKVLDLTQFGNGPSATGMLSDNGADVLKVEPPEGEGLRTTPPGKYNALFQNFNRGKRSMTMDLKHPESKAVMERLVRWADIMMENFRPGVLERLGYGYEDVKKWNPTIIYASNSGFGPEGEWAQRPSYDGIAQAFNGVTTVMGGGPSHEPMFVDWGFSDEIGAMNFYQCVLAALVHRYRTGEGQQVTTSQTAGTLYFQRGMLQAYVRRGEQPDDGEKPGATLSGGQQALRGSDGLYFVASFGGREKQFKAFINEVLKKPELIAGRRAPPRGTSPEGVKFKAEVAKVIATMPRKHWIDLCIQHEVPVAPCSSYGDIADPKSSAGAHLRANGYIRENDHRDFGKLTTVAPTARYSATPNQDVDGSWHAPDLGEHTGSVLTDVLGYSAAEAQALMAKGGPTPPPVGPVAPKKPR